MFSSEIACYRKMTLLQNIYFRLRSHWKKFYLSFIVFTLDINLYRFHVLISLLSSQYLDIPSASCIKSKEMRVTEQALHPFRLLTFLSSLNLCHLLSLLPVWCEEQVHIFCIRKAQSQSGFVDSLPSVFFFRNPIIKGTFQIPWNTTFLYAPKWVWIWIKTLVPYAIKLAGIYAYVHPLKMVILIRSTATIFLVIEW